ncbi:MAG: Dockerin type domain, partial [Planctomycetota bacterium]
NNWKPDVVIDVLENPGGDGIVIFVGVAAPPRRGNINPPACPGDLNGDGVINALDLATLLSNWGLANPASPASDINGDGVVNAQDLASLLSAWGPCNR